MSPAKKAAKKAAAKKAPAAKKTAAKKAPAAKKTAAKAPAAKKTAAKKSAAKSGNSAFNKPMTPSAELAAVVGPKPGPRTEFVSRIWEYIKANGLQDAKNKRNINADEKLKVVFGGKKQVTMFELTGILGKHLKG